MNVYILRCWTYKKKELLSVTTELVAGTRRLAEDRKAYLSSQVMMPDYRKQYQIAEHTVVG